MDWLNYHHLFYFSVIAQEGGVAPAARKLHITHSTLSTQLRALEEQLGARLFERRGKRLVLTAFGVDAASYAADIFRFGRELSDVARGRAAESLTALRVGVVSAMPKTLAHRLLAPALDRHGEALVLRQDNAPVLLEALASGSLHLILMNDVPTSPVGAKLYSHLLGETEIVLFARAVLARRARATFPASLSKMPLILPPSGAALRKKLDAWFSKHNIDVHVKAEVDDAGLLRALGAGGRGIFPVRSAVRAEVDEVRDLREVGRCQGVRESYYAVTAERKLRHPGVAAIIDNARADLDTNVTRRPR